MQLTNSADQYGLVTKFFHWTTAALILAIIPLGLVAHQMPYDTDAQLSQKAFLFSAHKTLGVTVFFVALLRILWAMSQPKPGSLHPDRKGETFLAELVHWLLYGSLVLAPLSGWLHHAATTGFAPIWWPFGQSLPFVPKDPAVAEVFGQLHWIWTKVMAASILLHVAGALKHHFIDKDVTLKRMWFGTVSVPAVAAHIGKRAAPLGAIVLFAATGAATALISSDAQTPVTAELTEVASDWEVQNGSIGITVRQFGADVTGEFADWTADITFDPEQRNGEVRVEIAIGSLSLGSVTDQAMGSTYFDVERFPTAVFEGPITHISGDTYVTNGKLTLKGAEVDVALDYTLTEAADGWMMSGSTRLDRRDFGIGENGGEANLGFEVVVDVAVTARDVTIN